MKKLVLVGSGEFQKAMEQIDRYLLSLLEKEKKEKSVVIIPTAAGLEKTPNQWIKDGVLHFKKIGAEPLGIKVLKKADTRKPMYLETVKTASFIYFSGGHPGYLYKTLKGSLLWKAVYSRFQNDIILTGSSAGAMVMGDYVLGNAQEVFSKDEKPVWTKAFGLVPYSIIPHFDYIERKKPQLLKRIIEVAPQIIQQQLLGIDENTALLIFNQKKVTIQGQGRALLFGKKAIKSYSDGQSFLIA